VAQLAKKPGPKEEVMNRLDDASANSREPGK
jgi:hypothetical protein